MYLSPKLRGTLVTLLSNKGNLKRPSNLIFFDQFTTYFSSNF